MHRGHIAARELRKRKKVVYNPVSKCYQWEQDPPPRKNGLWGFLKRVYKWLVSFLYGRPNPPTNLMLRSSDMAKVTATWVKSTSANVVKQVLTYSFTDVEAVVVELDKDVESFVIENVPSPTTVSVGLMAKSEVKDSDPVFATVDVADFSKPEAPTGLTLTVEE